MAYTFDLAAYLEEHPIASAPAIARENSVSRYAVARQAKRLGIKLPRKQWTHTTQPNISDRGLLIRAYIKQHPQDTLQAIGDHFGLSRERIRQIAAKADIQRGWRERPLICSKCRQYKQHEEYPLTASGLRSSTCKECALAWQSSRPKPRIYKCDRCGEFYILSGRQLQRKKTSNKAGRSKSNVCPKCFHPGATQVSCATCGHIFEVGPFQVRRARAAGHPLYCSLECMQQRTGGRHKRQYTPRPRKSFEERFWSKVNETESCWLWTGSRGGSNYGHAWQKRKSLSAHRLSWVWQNGPIPNGTQLRHSCPNKHCVNPEHLYLLALKERKVVQLV